jgi:hypothetical protein
MENPYLILISAAITIAVLACFFTLCANVAKLLKLAKEKENDYEEYTINLKMGEKEKAYFHLKRSLAKDQMAGINQLLIDDYRKKFENLGLGIPDMDILKNE